MQTESNPTPKTTPTTAQRHDSQLQDYEALLTTLRPYELFQSFTPSKLSKQIDLSKLRIKPSEFSGLEKRDDAGLASVTQMAMFYGIAPWDTTDPVALRAVIKALEEKQASFRLMLEHSTHIVGLIRPPIEKDRQRFAAARRASSDPESVEMEDIQKALISSEIIEALNSLLPEGETSPFSCLAREILLNANEQQLRATPSVYLEKILQSPLAETMATAVLSALKWYGGDNAETTSPPIRLRVLANALMNGFEDAYRNPQHIAGFDWQTRSHWGKSYATLRSEFEKHLLTSRQAASEKEAIILARLFLNRFPVEFRITDIPPEMGYRNSIVWVNFLNGVNLINAHDPEALYRKSFQQLVDLPIKQAEGATDEQLQEISLARLLPTLDWAVTQGYLPEKAFETLTQSEIEMAIRTLDERTAELNNATTQINEAPPKRLEMAKETAIKVFGKNFVQGNTRMVRKRPDYFRWDTTPGEVYDYYSLIDIIAEDKWGNGEKWYYTTADGAVTPYYLSINQNRRLTSPVYLGTAGIPLTLGVLPNVKSMFHHQFQNYVQRQTVAYSSLLRNLLTSLPFEDRLAIECGQLHIYSLRQETRGIESGNETAEVVLPLRARNGLILRATRAGVTNTYELLPRVGLVRRINNLQPSLFGGLQKTEQWRLAKGTVPVSVLRNQQLPFDWDAHSTGTAPQGNATCQAIIEQLGDEFSASAEHQETPLTFDSVRCQAISQRITDSLLYVDPQQLRVFCNGKTQFEREDETYNTILEFYKRLVPFWGSIEDLMSGNKTRQINGAFGLFIDLIAFAMPIGKFVSGSAKLVGNASRLTLSARLPAFKALTAQLLVQSIQALNPVDGIVMLLRALATKGLKIAKLGLTRINELGGRAGHYDFVGRLPQIDNPGSWKSRHSTDHLATVRGIEDVQVRNVDRLTPRFHLVDPLTDLPFGPRLSTRHNGMSLGRSHFTPLKADEAHVFVQTPEQARIQHIPEVDGRTTVLIDEVPYRLDAGTLRRADLIDDGPAMTRIPCRLPRAPGGGDCRVSYVTQEPAPTPAMGSIDRTKGYAPWFGDRISVPGSVPRGKGEFLAVDAQLYQILNNRAVRFTGDPARLGLKRGPLLPSPQIQATLQFRKGIFARVSLKGTYQGVDDTHLVGAIVVPAIDDTANHAFFRVNTREYYLATIPRTGTTANELRFTRLQPDDLMEGTLGAELLKVYTGSLHANNMVRFHGAEAVERAMQTMEDIAIPLGTTATPAANMRFIKVDTSPGEALMFDHSTRLIVARLPEGAASWTRSKQAPQVFRERTAEIFDTLFLSPTISPRNADAALRIDQSMQKLHNLLPRYERPLHARNIAYAEVTTTSGQREVYVSVSGAQGSTTRLPLFRHLGANHVRIGDATYINIDYNTSFPRTSLDVTGDGQLLAVPLTLKDPGQYKTAMFARPTSLDSESKLIRVIREKYPDAKELRSVDVVTTMSPCESCSMVIKAFGHDGTKDILQVLWN